ncbi:iron ABC transporter substrate-binding protein [Nodularia sphaerocarpa]|uniref:iron ABC transporter substrate-binding protein n=1 Tax=Nodularia sphaerocarpa TaxID=137816 RepID=UPI001EFB5E77|nr:iron ABC transporter substrate-binding protein [Nodularia sphaerocarpa]MDB9373025.1 iron ABC transporter substrate-binding protein [Nodularia sphaerocarpa CS-585]MDB9377222.1 iron ABC transporter substrate-binding protein [Nodularia sphaerocarpa CS-585A2]ULP73950.1 Iron-utilization periplasmic protein [Nodularia sphaerocarpa UHCC 0038]
MKRRQFVYLVGIATASGGLAVACDGNSNQTATELGQTATELGQTATELEQELVIYSGRNEKLIGELIKQFEAKTNAKVQVRYGDTAELASAILEEGTNSPADVFFAQDAGALGAIQKAGRAVQLPSSLLNKVDSAYRSPQGQWVGVTGRVRTVDYNTNLVKSEELPSSIFGFTDPKWKGKIGWSPTNGSFQSFVTGLRVAEGEERAKQWLEGIKANDAKVYPNNTSIVQALTRGEIALGFVNHYYLEQVKKDNPQVPVVHHFTEDIGSLVNVAGIAILNSAKHPNIAQRFGEFLLNEDAQNYFASQTAEYPLAAGVAPQGNLKSLNEIRKQDKKIDLSNLNDLDNTLKLLQEVAII